MPEWTVVAKDYHSPLVRNEIWVNFCCLWPELFALPKPDVGIVSRRNEISYVVEMNSWTNAKHAFQKRIQENPSVLGEVIRLSEEWGRELNNFTQTVFDSNLTALNAEELIEKHRDFARLQSRQYAVGILLPL